MSEERDRLDLVSRRGIMKGGAAGAALLPVARTARAQDEPVTPTAEVARQTMPITLDINGQRRDLSIDTRSTLRVAPRPGTDRVQERL
jgi:xanthine dehydrogenase YagT iron-sulfur-binding subunit